MRLIKSILFLVGWITGLYILAPSSGVSHVILATTLIQVAQIIYFWPEE